MDRAPLAGQSAAGREQRRSVKQPRLVVAPYADPDARLGHCAENTLGQFRLRVLTLVAADQQTIDAQIKDETRRGAQIIPQNRCERPRVGAQPFDNRLGVRRRRECASVAKDRFGKPRVDLREFRQRVADGSLADGEVIVIGPQPSLMRADAYAHTQPQAREAEKRGYLVFDERVFGVVTLDDFSRDGQRVRLVQHGVSDRDGEIGHSEAVDHISEIDQSSDALASDALASDALASDALANDALADNGLADHALALRVEIIAGADDHGKIIRVVVNRALAEPRQYRRDVLFKLGGEADYKSARLRVRDQRLIFANHTQTVGQVPVKIAVNGLMIEIRERAIDPADAPPEIAQQLRRMTFQVSERDAGQPIDHPYEMPHPGRRSDFGQKSAGLSWRYTLPTRRALGDARHRLLLRFKQRAVFQRVRYLENVLPAGSVLQ